MMLQVDSFWPGYYGGSAGQLLCFDVGDAVKPSLASSVNLSVEQNEDGKAKYANRWNFSEAILNDNGLVYLSSQHTDYVEIEPDEGDEEEERNPNLNPTRTIPTGRSRSPSRNRFPSRAVTGSPATSCTWLITPTCSTRWYASRIRSQAR